MVEIVCHGLDTPSQVFFYEQEFYVLSNFSSFNLLWKDRVFPTSEHAYQWSKFDESNGLIRNRIFHAGSAHAAYEIAKQSNDNKRADWNAWKVGTMREIIRAKAMQHRYVMQKLLETGERDIIENSWRDGFWGWGADQKGQNMLGRLWMELRSEMKIK